MATIVRFTKMHGAGNDYIYVNTLLYNIPDPTKAAKAKEIYKAIPDFGGFLVKANSEGQPGPLSGALLLAGGEQGD